MKTILNLFLTTFVALNAQNSIISGFISDSSSGEALIGANIFLQETGQGMATGDFFLVENKTINGFDVTFKNSSNSAVSRTFDFIAKGF